MLHKARLFIAMFFGSFLLLACGNEPMEEPSSVEATQETIEVQEDNTSEENKNVETTATNNEAEAETVTETNEAETDTESETSVEDHSTAAENSTTTETLDSINQAAIDHFIATTGLNVEDYTFSFETTEEYVEINVYEKQEDEQAHTPLAGIYRYMLDSEEILMQDYLTGAFIPLEETE